MLQTGNSAGGLLYYIASNPEKQEKLREEVLSVLPDKTSLITYDILQQLRYTKACVKESLRLFPAAIGNLRTMPTDVCIGGYKIPAGVFVTFISHISQHLITKFKIYLVSIFFKFSYFKMKKFGMIIQHFC